MNVIGYTRVSTDEQAAEGISLYAQRAKIDAYCVANDWQVASVETDAGFSAKDTNRPSCRRSWTQ